jgi:hypothetical protein
MSMSVGSSSDALSYIQSLLQSLANTAGNVAGVGSIGDMFAGASTDGASGSPTQSGTSTSAFGPAPPPFQNGTMAALIALQGQNTTGAGGAQSLFGKLDSDGDGAVSKSEFEGALGQSGVDTSSADALFGKLDQNGDGSIDQGELTSATKRGHGHHHHHMNADGDQGGFASLLDSTSASGAKTQTATNADGSSTTTISYADGSTVTLTTPAAPTGGASTDSGSSTQAAAKSGGINLIEQLIKMQAQLGSQQGTTVSALA